MDEEAITDTIVQITKDVEELDIDQVEAEDSPVGVLCHNTDEVHSVTCGVRTLYGSTGHSSVYLEV